ncbi:MAG: PIN domain-containing protein [Gammaproteobacteria bacterium]|nr:PIN domain-containing protein [Gammaproteobacteria bacterium]
MKVFIDCDVLLDVGLDRAPFAEASGVLLDYLEENPLSGCIAWHSLSNIYYIATKTKGSARARDFIADLCGFLYIAPTSNQDVLKAIQLPMPDFEDALQCAAALACGAERIVTRNVDDYANAPILVSTPKEYIGRL